jgi:hypothetical protein
MSSIKDWTVLNSTPVLQKKQSSSAAFFTKHDLGNGLTGCCFKSKASEKGLVDVTPVSSIEYELGIIKIPAGFIHVGYDLDTTNGVVTINEAHLDEALKLKTGILTPILLPKNAAITANHICLNFKKEEAVADSIMGNETKKGSVEGCATLISSPDRSFELFYYSNKTLHDDKIVRISRKKDILASEITDSTATVTRGEYFFVPILLSEKIVVYYAISIKENGDKKENWLDEVSANLTTFYKTVSDHGGTAPKRLAEIIQPLVLSDHLGIWVTTDIKLYESA